MMAMTTLMLMMAMAKASSLRRLHQQEEDDDADTDDGDDDVTPSAAMALIAYGPRHAPRARCRRRRWLAGTPDSAVTALLIAIMPITATAALTLRGGAGGWRGRPTRPSATRPTGSPSTTASPRPRCDRAL